MPHFWIPPSEDRFPLGDYYITWAASHWLSPEAIEKALQRHAKGDWGDVGEADRRHNETALQKGAHLFSVYQENDDIFWVITEADRSGTFVFMPSDC